jgi:uncharacterized membrane protein YbhN (UPF0104 family)
MSALLILAQASGPGTFSNDMPTGLMVVLIVAAVMAVPITAIINGIKYATRERELAHAERMKALEHGVPLDEIEEERRFRKGIMRLAAGIGVAVPICAVGAATGAVLGLGNNAPTMFVFLIWTGASTVGVAGAASGAWLAQGAMARLNPGAPRHSGNGPIRGGYEAPHATLAH